MRKSPWVLSFFGLLFVLIVGPPLQAQSFNDPSLIFPEDRIIIGTPDDPDDDEDGDDGNQGFGFGKKVAGTYLDEGEIPEGSPFKGIQTLTADGTQYAQNLNGLAGFGIQDNDPDATYSSAGQGAWKKTGQRSLRLTAIIYIFNATGEVSLIAKPNLDLLFEPDFQTASGPLTTELFGPDDDPLTDEPFLVVTGFDTWRRLTVE